MSGADDEPGEISLGGDIVDNNYESSEFRTVEIKEALSLIEKRYKRLKGRQRRPSMEYVTPEAIRDVLFEVLPEKSSSIRKMTNEDCLQLYEKIIIEERENDHEHSLAVNDESSCIGGPSYSEEDSP